MSLVLFLEFENKHVSFCYNSNHEIRQKSRIFAAVLEADISTKLLAEKIAHSLILRFLIWKCCSFFKVIVPKETIFSEVVTKDLRWSSTQNNFSLQFYFVASYCHIQTC